jgi:hypothetical protein
MNPNARYLQPSFRRLIKFRPNEMKMSHFVAVTLFIVNVVHEDVNGVQPSNMNIRFPVIFYCFPPARVLFGTKSTILTQLDMGAL